MKRSDKVSVQPYGKRSNLLEVEASKLAKSTGVLDSTASIFDNLATKRSSIVERLPDKVKHLREYLKAHLSYS